MSAKLTAEFVGTYLLIFTVGCNVLGGQAVWGGVSIACVLMVAIYALGGISGANFNPAVTATLAMVNSMGGPGGMDGSTAGQYIATQLVAGLCAAFSYSALWGTSFNLAPAKGFGWLNAGLCEFFYTFMLCFVVLNVAVAKKTMYYGLAIGFVIVAGAYGAGAVSGGCFNPAVAVGIDASSVNFGFGWCIIYIVFELLGAAAAAVCFKMVRPEQFSTAGVAVAEAGGMQAKLTSEFLGTFMLVLTVGLNVLGGSPAGAFSIAAALMCMIYALGDVSGAHFNPAVTAAIFMSGRCQDEASVAAKYVLAQIVGGITAAFTYVFIRRGDTFPLGPSEKYGWSQIAVAEIVFTFVLCYVVLAVAVSQKTAAPEYFGLAIGSCVTVGGFAIGGISGGSLNPAVSFGIAASHILGGGLFYKALIYSGFELAGAVGAATVFKFTHACDVDAKSEV
jgi:aquaporin Z